MRDPQAFFADPVERDLAAEAWKVGGNTDTDPFFTWYAPHEMMLHMVETPFQKQVITSRNWITAMRDQGGPWGDTGVERVKAYFKQMYGRDFPVSNTQIGNVEHFFTSALMVAISGTFFVLLEAGTIDYEVWLQPVAVALTNFSLVAGWNNLKNNWKQLTGPDRQGIVFMLMNSNYSSLDIQQFLTVEPEVAPPGPLPPRNKPATPPTAPAISGKTVTVQGGQSLSSIARDLYKSPELWPLLWDSNKPKVPNPNKVKPGMVLQYKELSEFNPTQIADARRRSPTWKNYPL